MTLDRAIAPDSRFYLYSQERTWWNSVVIPKRIHFPCDPITDSNPKKHKINLFRWNSEVTIDIDFVHLYWLEWVFLRAAHEKSDIFARDAFSKSIHSATWIKPSLTCTRVDVMMMFRKFQSHLVNSVREKASTPLLNRPNHQMMRTQTLIFSFKHRSPDPFSWWVGSNDA